MLATMAVADLYEAEIRRRSRQRSKGVWLCVVFALLFSTGVVFSIPMMHGEGDFSKTTGTVVALGTGSSGEPTFTSEFTDGAGVVHRDTNSYGYHYASGDPKIGDRIEYLYKTLPETGDLRAFPRADSILQLVFGVPAALFVLMAALFTWIIARERAFRRRLVRDGRREPLEAAQIGLRSVVIPGGSGGSHRVDMWRLQGRYFDPAQGEYVDCHSNWEPQPAPELTAEARPEVFIDPTNSSRYWVPLGALMPRK